MRGLLVPQLHLALLSPHVLDRHRPTQGTVQILEVEVEISLKFEISNRSIHVKRYLVLLVITNHCYLVVVVF